MVFKKSEISELTEEDMKIISRNISLLKITEEKSGDYSFLKARAKFDPETGELIEKGKNEIGFYFERSGGMSYSSSSKIAIKERAKRNIWASMRAFYGIYFQKE